MQTASTTDDGLWPGCRPAAVREPKGEAAGSRLSMKRSISPYLLVEQRFRSYGPDLVATG